MKLPTVLAALFLAGCAATGTVAPQSFDEKLAYAESQVTAFETSAAQAVAAGTLKPAAAQQVLNYADQATAAITAARSFESANDMTSATSKLALASSLLAQLAATLQAQGVK